MSVICVDPRTDPLWETLVTQCQSSVFHSPAWIQVLAETYDWKAQAYVILNDAGEPEAGLPFFQIADARGERIVSLPFSDYCDPLVATADQWNTLLDGLLVEHVPITVRCLHNSIPLADSRFLLVDRAKWHGLDLRPDIDTHWRKLDSSARRAIQKAQRDGVEIRVAQDVDELRVFYQMHLGIRKHKYHLLAQPYRFFENIWHQFMDQGCGLLMLAVYQDRIIGGVLFLEWQDTLVYKFNASNPNFLAHRPTDLLIWEAIHYGKSKGYDYLDFGLSDWDQDGLIRFKRKFATEEKTISFLRYPTYRPPNLQQKHFQSLLPQLTDLFTDASVSDAVTEKAGDLLYRFFG